MSKPLRGLIPTLQHFRAIERVIDDAHLPPEQKVRGSNPLGRTKSANGAIAVRIPAVPIITTEAYRGRGTRRARSSPSDLYRPTRTGAKPSPHRAEHDAATSTRTRAPKMHSNKSFVPGRMYRLQSYAGQREFAIRRASGFVHSRSRVRRSGKKLKLLRCDPGPY